MIALSSGRACLYLMCLVAMLQKVYRGENYGVPIPNRMDGWRPPAKTKHLFPWVWLFGTLKTMLSSHQPNQDFKQTADSDTITTYQVSSVQLVTDKKLGALNKAYLRQSHSGAYTRSTLVEGLSVLCETVSLVNKWRLSQMFCGRQ